MLLHRAHTIALLAVTATVLATVPVTAMASVPSLVPASSQPHGVVAALAQQGIGFHIDGWAVDPRIAGPATVYVRVDAKRVATLTADLKTSVPGAPRNTGFDALVPTAVGTHKVCAAVNDPRGHTTIDLSCTTITLDHDPIGAITSIAQLPGQLVVAGWAIDRDTPVTAREVAIRVDGRAVVRQLANLPVAGLSTTHPLAGDDHGFSVHVPITEGTHQVCLKVFNGGQGFDAIAQCMAGVKVNFSPVGALTKVMQVPDGVRVEGWASDPDTTAPTAITVTENGITLGTASAAGSHSPTPGHGFDASVTIPRRLAPGPRTICVLAKNLGRYGETRTIACTSHTFDWNPTSGLEHATQKSPGALVSGWALDPDTSGPIKVAVTADGTQLATVTANGTTGSHPGHMFSTLVPLADGRHTVCVAAINVGAGSANATPSCSTITLNFDPYGSLEHVGRAAGSSSIVATGWAIDPDTTRPISVRVSVDGGPVVTATADIARPDILESHPGTGPDHGYSVTVPASAGEHRHVCVSAVNVLAGAQPTTPLGCKLIDAVHPNVPSAPTAVAAIGGYGGARITWTSPTSDGGAPWTSYTITALPHGPSLTVAANQLAATVLGLAPSTRYAFRVTATNVAGTSAAGTSASVRTQKQPPPQTSPAPISTSRYIRNVTGATTGDLAAMRREGASDAKANPSGHGYLVVLDIGGQVESSQGVILSAGIRFVAYSDMVKDLNAYLDGYASQQRPSAPVTLAIATNNDIDVYRASGADFASKIINPVRAHASRYPGITVAGSDDMEPGFRASLAATRSWLQGYLGATTAPFVFTGSADGCAYSYTGSSCNNGWSMQGLFYLAGGAAPIRIISMPQVYNTVMAQQWRYISLTGVDTGLPKIDFGGALTEYTACRQAGSCGSLTAVTAWKEMWAQLRSEPKLRPASLPYSTDLRIDS